MQDIRTTRNGLAEEIAAYRFPNAILKGLQSQPGLYGGTVAPAVRDQRRAKNKAARKARRAARR